MFRWWRSLKVWEGEAARQCILGGHAQRGMRVRGSIDLLCERIVPLPDDFRAQTVVLSDCAQLRRLPSRLTCERLILQRSAIAELPNDLHVSELIDARDCRNLESVGAVAVQRLVLSGCVRLESLPRGLTAASIDLSGCYRLRELPEGFGVTLRALCLRDCACMDHLPSGMMRLESLDVRGCRQLTSLPDEIRVRSWIDVAGSGLAHLPWSLRSVRVCWNGLHVPDRVAFDPESITVAEILAERNAEMRRVLLECVGYAWFIDHAHAAVLDQDSAPGGARRLLRIRFDGEEDYVFVEVHCPSTLDRYILRVPPDMRTCQQAVAWTAGYSTPDRYRPVQET